MPLSIMLLELGFHGFSLIDEFLRFFILIWDLFEDLKKSRMRFFKFEHLESDLCFVFND
jgi:hypothetical protein